MMQRRIVMQPDWLALLQDQFEAPYMLALAAYLRERRSAGAHIYPPPRDWFSALWYTPPQRVAVVVLGQDPYHNPGQAHGLCFSVPPGVAVPPSLHNIYKELNADLGIAPSTHGSLIAWARRGVLLLNSVLTVEQGRAGAHQGRGWEQFTDALVERLAQRHEHLVFMLWGSYAQKKGARIDQRRHCVLRAPHPSPLSAHRGFFGCGHFSAANAYRESHGLQPLDWQLPDLEEAQQLAAENMMEAAAASR